MTEVSLVLGGHCRTPAQATNGILDHAEGDSKEAASVKEAVGARGRAVFNGRGNRWSCHIGSLGTAAGYNAVPPSGICIDSLAADRDPTGRTRSVFKRPSW